MESSAPLQADVIAAFVYQLYLGLTKEGPESLPPAPKIPQDMKSGYSNGSSSFSSGNDALADFLIPPGVHRQKPPTLVGLESGNLGNEPRMTSPEELHLRETSNASPNGEHMPIMEYTASPTFHRPQFKMYGGVEEDQSSSEDEDSRMGRDDSQTVRIRKVSDVKAEKEGLQEEGAWKGGRETCISGGAEVGGSHPQGQVDSTAQGLTVLDALRERHQTEGGVSSGPDSNVSSPSRPSQLSVSEISLTEVTIPEALPTLAEETADTEQEVVIKHKEGKGDSAKENRRRLPPAPGAVRGGSGGASVIIVLEGTERVAVCDHAAYPHMHTVCGVTYVQYTLLVSHTYMCCCQSRCEVSVITSILQSLCRMKVLCQMSATVIR